MSQRFNLRVYGLIFNSKGEVLISDEHRFGTSFTKFPGGGIEFGEGISEALIREIKEEIGVKAEIQELIYVNDFYQESAFRRTDQIVSFYYKVSIKKLSEIPISENIKPTNKDGERFRWFAIEDITESTFTFPIDKHVGKLIQSL